MVPACLIRAPHREWCLQAEQMADLRNKWEQTKIDAKKEHGTAEHLELPDIVIKHEMTYEAPPGKANADRPMPLPRSLVGLASILSSACVRQSIAMLSTQSFGHGSTYAGEDCLGAGRVPTAGLPVATTVSRQRLWTACSSPVAST